MDGTQKKFEIIYRTKAIPVQEFLINGQTLFRVMIPGQTPLTILRASHIEGHRFWTSVPEGRQELAGQIGILIENHYRSHQ